MKRVLFIIFICLALLCSCNRQKKYEILDYQSKDIEAECTVNEKYKIILRKEGGNCTVTVCEPQSLAGIYFEFKGEEITAVAGDTKIKLSKDELKGIYALSCIFSQREECLRSAVKSGDGSILSFEGEDCSYAITLGEGSLPKHVKINGDTFSYEVEIQSIRLI